MDTSRVSQIARRHRAASGHPDEARTAGSLVEEQIRGQLESVWTQLAADCLAFCDAYNTAYGRDRLYCQPHDDSLVVRSADEPQETITFTRLQHGSVHRSHITAHRYSLTSPPTAVPLETHLENGMVIVRLDGRPINPSDAVLDILERFTGELGTRTDSGPRID